MNIAKHSIVAATLAASVASSGPPPENVRKDASAFQDALEGMGGTVYKNDALRVKQIRESSREVDFIASTGALDCHWEIIDQESWQLDDYITNPVVLYGHNAYDLPIGQCTYVAVRGDALECTIKFASAEANPEAEKVWLLVKEKVLRALSVGFRPVNGAYEVRDGEDVWVWRNSILKEISVVAIPANPEALAKMKAATPPRAGGTKNESPAGPPALNINTTKKGTENMKTLEQLAADLEAKTAAHNETMAKLGSVNVKLVETEQRAEKAEAGVKVAEAALATRDAEIVSLKKAAHTLETEHTKACSDRDAAVKKSGELEDRLIDLEVEAIVGKKIAPTEKAEFVELRKSNEKLFKSMVEKRADMKLEERVTTPDAKVNPKGETTLNGSQYTPGAAAAGFNEL